MENPNFHVAEESQLSVDVDLLQQQGMKLYSNSWRRRRQIQKVPPQIRRRVQGIEQVYDPMLVSIGPYHHGKPELRRAEEFKHLCLDRFTGGDEQKKAFFYSKILEEVLVIRNSYSEAEIVEKHDDESLAWMMLLDGCMIIDFMLNYIDIKGDSFFAWERCLGVGSGPLMTRDILVIENQIPFLVVKLLIGMLYEKEEGAFLVSRFLQTKTGIMEMKHVKIPGEEEDPPIHLLEVFWRLLVRKHHGSKDENIFSTAEEMCYGDDGGSYYTPPRSVMDLKAKGIRVRPNSTRSLRDITFRRNLCFSELHLPLLVVSNLTPVAWANMIAFEVLPDSRSIPIVLSYALFLKSLIQTPKDVKELQEKGVILNMMANLERVVEIHKEIDTFGLYDLDLFKDVKKEMEEHCRSRVRNWFAELIYTRFRTPWTAMALLAAGVLLCLTFLQTFFTIRRH